MSDIHTTYTNTRAFFLKTLERMQKDLDEYRNHESAKPRYIEKQTAIIRVLTQYYDAVEEEIDIEKQFGTYCDTEMLHRDEVIRALVLVCDMAHVNPSLIAESLHRAETTIKFDHDAHCFICNDPRHDYYKKLYQQTPGTLCHDDKRSREFFKSLGLEYPEGA